MYHQSLFIKPFPTIPHQSQPLSWPMDKTTFPTTNQLLPIFLHNRGSAVGFQITTHHHQSGWRLLQHKVDNCMMYSSISLKHQNHVVKGTKSSCVFTKREAATSCFKRHLVHILQISAMVSTLEIYDVLWFICVNN